MGPGWGETMAGIPKPVGKKLEFLTEKGFSQEGYSWRRDSTGLRGLSARIPAGGDPGLPWLHLDPNSPQLRPSSAARVVRESGAHLVYLHRRGAGVRGQVGPFQVKCPGRERRGEGVVAAALCSSSDSL